jgi:hypothetical protein
MNFNFDDIHTTEKLLTRFGEEDIMERMGVPIEDAVEGGRFCSPYRNDSTPTCSVWRAPGNDRLYYMDWAVFDEPLDIYELYMHVYSVDSFKEASDGIWDMMTSESSSRTALQRISEIRSKSSDETKVTAVPRSWSKEDVAWWSSFGITKETLIHFNVQPVQSVFLGQDIIYNYIQNVVKPGYVYTFNEAIKVYFPHRNYNRFYHDSGKIVQGWDQLPAEGDFVVVTKSLKDVMLLHELGISAVAPMSESILLDQDSVASLKKRFQHVVVLMDNDHAGIVALRKYKVQGLRILMLSRHWSKDISDFYLKYGVNKTSRLINATKWHLLHGGASLSQFKL